MQAPYRERSFGHFPHRRYCLGLRWRRIDHDVDQSTLAFKLQRALPIGLVEPQVTSKRGRELETAHALDACVDVIKRPVLR